METTQDLLISDYIRKILRNEATTPEEGKAWKTRQAELKNLREHSPNCYCDNCI